MRALLLASVVVVASVVAVACTPTSTTTKPGPAAPLGVGASAPAFAARDQAGVERTLAEFAGRPLVLYFYPRDGTVGCTKEACAFRDVWQKYADARVAVVGVSNDTVESHQKFADEHKLQFPLLADTDNAISSAYGVGLNVFGGANRVTFLIDGDGKIARVFPDVDPGVHANEVLAAATALAP
jgi:peroxiredoxin Q/BCP